MDVFHESLGHFQFICSSNLQHFSTWPDNDSKKKKSCTGLILKATDLMEASAGNAAGFIFYSLCLQWSARWEEISQFDGSECAQAHVWKVLLVLEVTGRCLTKKMWLRLQWRLFTKKNHIPINPLFWALWVFGINVKILQILTNFIIIVCVLLYRFWNRYLLMLRH